MIKRKLFDSVKDFLDWANVFEIEIEIEIISVQEGGNEFSNWVLVYYKEEDL